MSSFPNAEILCTDIQTSRLVNLLEISDVTKSAALCIAAIITREIDEMCDLNIKETLLVAYKMIQDSDSSTQKSLLYLIKLCIDVIHAEDAADIFIDSKQINFISIIHQFCGTGKSDVEAETLDAFMRLFVKLQNLNKHQQLLEEFVQSGCFNLLEEMRDTENDELVEIIDAIIEYLRVDEE
ncbi:hypothetical protein TVAG_199360 [Trichomonas vaginalis G3]|uniref:Uncharacterized protein n=1 Tax=Trichomonas vaginalis (strain ATCC PRA-98 / G3) TaxID=412133 RepID=A2DDX1_TRIV3|nr:armadillo (ARM) repeat-containing protein family [Trichomonas vaginalis G3]EAY21497.1 hypothetical protein TVAG_199360 [Trichomonas vaginalis G3]KAI5490713.1 armadillo (ARM) repeat-containing protein family [Trichomonas vaginalis G3]|eukprot:XP_001582483.1 hypothetical protein [Trichomonas vaginalis G3]